MTKSLSSILDQLEARIDGLHKEIAMLKEKNLQLEAENEDLRSRERETLQKLDKANLDSQYLMMSHRLASSPDTIIETRRMIAGLIRNIDRCIEMLKE